jgi:HEPN domain-containing protein
MAKHEDLKKITDARLKTIDILIEAGDWPAAAYMMGYSLECALKAAACKTLHFSIYPPTKTNKKIEEFFRTHSFDVLIIVSGMLDIFGSGGSFWEDWSAFTQEFLGSWTEMRYEMGSTWDEIKTKSVYNNLKALIREIKKRW